MSVTMPCEIIVWKLLPVLRKELAKEMKELGISQKEIAQRLGVTPAAVSQYITAKRGKDLDLNDEFKAEIKASAKRLADKSFTTGDDCYLDLAISFLERMESSRKTKILLRKMATFLAGDAPSYQKRGIHEQMGRVRLTLSKYTQVSSFVALGDSKLPSIRQVRTNPLAAPTKSASSV